MESFKLLSLFVKDNNEIIFDVDFTDSKINNEIFTTVVIGENGSGKSFMLATIAEIFREINFITHLKKLTRNSYQVKKIDTHRIVYELNGQTYKYERSNNIVSSMMKIEKHWKQLSGDKFPLPNAIVVSSFLLNDKFPYPKKDSFDRDFYKYIGIKNVSNAAFTNNVEKQIADIIVRKISDRIFSKKLIEVLDFLGYNSFNN